MAQQKRIDTDRWLDEHGDTLFGYAIVRLGDRDLAEDIVQETFLAALRGQDTYLGQSSERTWLIGILKHKLMDHYRKRYRERSLTDAAQELQDDPVMEQMFDDRGHWKPGPSRWGNPRAALHEKEFWRVLRECIQRLPERLADTFRLRVLDELSSEDVRNIMNISTTNLGVMLYRARLHLRHCLERNWFHGPTMKGNT
ncbi:MAG: sigma-70 family RNA polymerase sigma factor [bacterium]